MRSVRLHGPGDLRVDELDDLPIGEGQIRVDVAYAGICGSDLHEYEIGPVPIRAEEKDHVIPESEWDDHLPKGMGHEIAGTVAEVGAGVEDVAVGDEITLNLMAACGECQYCVEGKHNLCEGTDSAGAVPTLGFADDLVVPAATAVHVPDGVPLRHAALTEPLSVSIRGVRRSGMAAGDSVAVFGSGPIGLGVVAAANAGGAGEIHVSEPNATRREAAAEMGADHLYDPTEDDARTEIREATGGVDAAFETAGVGPALTDALRATKHDGTVVVLSVFEEETSIHPNDVMQAERTVVGSFAYNGGPRAASGEYGTALDLLADGRIDPEPMVSGTVDLDGTADAFESLLEPDTDHVKVLVSP